MLRHHLEGVAWAKRRLDPNLPPNLHYYSTEDFVLDRGADFKSSALTPEEYTILCNAVDHAGGLKIVSQPRMCFTNAQRVVLRDSTGKLAYAEGFAVGSSQYPVHHGWITLNSKVIDLTWKQPRKAHGRRFAWSVLGTIPEEWAYLGVTFSNGTVMQQVESWGHYQTFIDNWMESWPLFQQERLHPFVELDAP